MNLDNIGTQLLFTTVPIWVLKKDGKKSSGTGFLYTVPDSKEKNSSIPFLVTNEHVVKNADKVVIEMVTRKGDKPEKENKVRAQIDGVNFEKYVNHDNDLSVLPIGPIINQFESNRKPIFYRTISPNMIPEESVIEKLGAIEEVTFIGYPSGIYDEVNSAPLIRRGITASPIWYDFKGEKKFIIDAGVFPGSSGSPVFIYNQGSYSTDQGVSIGSRILFIGIISETYSRNDSDNEVFLGLGRVIKSSVLKSFTNELIAQFESAR